MCAAFRAITRVVCGFVPPGPCVATTFQDTVLAAYGVLLGCLGVQFTQSCQFTCCGPPRASKRSGKTKKSDEALSCLSAGLQAEEFSRRAVEIETTSVARAGVGQSFSGRFEVRRRSCIWHSVFHWCFSSVVFQSSLVLEVPAKLGLGIAYLSKKALDLSLSDE